jgi:DNA modification methylase
MTEMQALEAECVDLIIADPPYNLGKDYGNNHDVKGFDDYLAFSRAWLGEAYRLLKPNGTLYVFMGFRFISYLYDMLDRELGMFFNSWIVWHYTQGMGKKKGFSPRHDDILMFTKSKDFILTWTMFAYRKNITASVIICAARIPAMCGRFLMSITAMKTAKIIRRRSRKACWNAWY